LTEKSFGAMQSKAQSPEEYISQVDDKYREAISKLRKIILENIPDGFVEQMSYGMIGYVVPFSSYQKGYHCNPKLPLPFLNLAAQKNFIALYHMGIYANPELLNWFTNEFPKHSQSKLDMGKGCMRFKNAGQIPYEFIGELVQKMTTDNWIELYESRFLKK
jgi:uncharacterized protein YdhG (YjbR/CyaY superfamily)